MEHAQNYAALAQGAYHAPDKAHELSQPHNYEVVYNDFTDSSPSRSHTLFRHMDTEEHVLAFRGTDVQKSKGKDLLTDLQMTFGKFNKEFRRASDLTRKAKEQYGDNLILAGHSLGASKALKAGMEHNVRSITFNPFIGSGLGKRLKSYMRQTESDTHIQINDPIGLSALAKAPDDRVIVYDNGGSNPHTIKAFQSEGARLSKKKKAIGLVKKYGIPALATVGAAGAGVAIAGAVKLSGKA